MTENSPDTVPPSIGVDASGATGIGRCPGAVNLGDTPTNGTGINLGDPEITLTWNNEHDLDLRVIEPDATLVDWSAPGPAADTGRLDVDERCELPLTPVPNLRTEISNGGPEHIFWEGQSRLQDGVYEVWVDFFDSCIDPDSVDPLDPTGLLTSIPRIRLVIGNNADFFPGTDWNVQELVMKDFVGSRRCLLFTFERGVWPPQKCGRDFAQCCLPGF